MARPTDETKLQAIKKAAMQIVVEQGLSGASISQIAKKAGVSDGYLYRFYAGKRELLESLFRERFQVTYEILRLQMASHNTVTELVQSFIHKVYVSAVEAPETIGFYHKMLSDFSFEIPEINRVEIVELCDEILQMGKQNGEIVPTVTAEQFFAIVIGGTLQFINIRLRAIFSSKSFTSEDVELNIEFILKTLQ